MEAEKGIVKVVTTKDLNKVSKKGTTYSVYNLEIEQDGKILKGKTLTFGEMTECKFKEGQEAIFTKEPDKYSEGNFEFWWGAKKKGGGKGWGREPENPKIRNVSMAMSYCHDIYVALLSRTTVRERMTLDQMFELTDRMIKYMNDKIDKINN